MRRIGRFATRSLAVALALALLGAVYQAVASRRAMAGLAMPGRLVEVGDHKIHLWCEGAGSPTVILEASGLGTSEEWRDLLPALAKNSKVCSTDRAGMGWSEEGPLPRDGARLAEELHAALAAGAIAPPYLLVGHSAGGLVVRLFAAAHPSEVFGLVLVDTVPDDALARMPEIPARMQRSLTLARIAVRLGLLRLANPFHLDDRDAALTYRAEVFDATAALVDGFGATFTELARAKLPDLPTVIITHGRGGDWAGPGVIPPSQADAIERAWQEGQAQLASHSTHARIVVAEHSGHMIPREQPDLIVRAIHDLLGR